MKTNFTKLTVLLAASFFCAAAHATPQEDDVARGQAMIINALVAGASVYAPAELKQARETLELSRRAIAQKDFAAAAKLATLAVAAARAAEDKALQQNGLVKTASR